MQICITGLGNPGGKYTPTRHNIGHRFIDYLAERYGISGGKEKFGGQYARGTIAGFDTYLLKPMKFMNLSGQTVAPFLQFFKVEPKHLIVVHDEIDLPFGECRPKFGGGHRGHNGLRDILKQTGQAEFWRLRAGVDRPGGPDVAGYVLSPFSRKEEGAMDSFMAEVEAQMDEILEQWK